MIWFYLDKQGLLIEWASNKSLLLRMFFSWVSFSFANVLKFLWRVNGVYQLSLINGVITVYRYHSNYEISLLSLRILRPSITSIFHQIRNMFMFILTLFLIDPKLVSNTFYLKYFLCPNIYKKVLTFVYCRRFNQYL